jgi:hypothetical protein
MNLATTTSENCMANSNQQHSKCMEIRSSQKWNTQIQVNSYETFHKVLSDQMKTASSFPSLFVMVKNDTTIHKEKSWSELHWFLKWISVLWSFMFEIIKMKSCHENNSKDVACAN